jgi:hypothetical protein
MDGKLFDISGHSINREINCVISFIFLSFEIENHHQHHHHLIQLRALLKKCEHHQQVLHQYRHNHNKSVRRQRVVLKSVLLNKNEDVVKR